MRTLIREVDANFARFGAQWKSTLDTVSTSLAECEDAFKRSYRRMVSLHAWRTALLDTSISTEPLAFFLEAQNDLLISHTLAQLGSWRPALKSLRSAIENVLFCMYYKDHPVELQLWTQGEHRLGFTEGMAYLSKHPTLKVRKRSLFGYDILSKEYSTLSRAVHASARSFRMTAAGIFPILWSDDAVAVGAWSTREAAVLSGLNLLLIAMYFEQLQGARHPNLRKSISLAIPTSKHRIIRNEFGVSLSRVPAEIV